MRVLIVPNVENDAALAVTRELASWLDGDGHDASLLPADAKAAGLGSLANAPEALERPDLTVAVGGDGTILRAVHALDGALSPVLGVNLGRLGFLSGADEHDMRQVVAAALAGEAPIERLAMLDIEIERADGRVEVLRALNEMFVGRGAGARAVELVLDVNGDELLRFVCDGVIVATPAGSTAYALSVGGPLVAPTVCGSVLVPVGAHTLAQRPFVLGPSDVVEIRCPNPARAGAAVVVDGFTLREGFELVRVSRGSSEVLLVRGHGRDFYRTVHRKFLGG